MICSTRCVIFKPLLTDGKSALHLVHIGDDGDVKVKLLENTEDKLKYQTGSRQSSQENVSVEQEKLVKFTVFDRNAR